jgi:hypothetical protein
MAQSDTWVGMESSSPRRTRLGFVRFKLSDAPGRPVFGSDPGHGPNGLLKSPATGHRLAHRLHDSTRRRHNRNVPQTLFDRIWKRHVVAEPPGEPALLWIDLHLVHEVTSPQAFEGLRLAGRPVRRPDLTLATMDHNVPT